MQIEKSLWAAAYKTRDSVAECRLRADIGEQRLHRALTAFQDDSTRAWSVKRPAKTACMSHSQFTGRFMAVLGHTPKGCVGALRMGEARAAPASGAPLKEVARRVVIGPTAAFSQASQRPFGRPPTAGASAP